MVLRPSFLALAAAVLLACLPFPPAARAQPGPGISASCSGAADATGCVQDAVDALCGKGGGTLHFPPGNYRIRTVTIRCSGIHLVGGGWGDRDDPSTAGTLVTGTGSGTEPVFYFNACATRSGTSYGAAVRDMQFQAVNPGSVRRPGPMVAFAHVEGGEVSHVFFYGPTVAVWVYAGIQNHVTDTIVRAGQDGARAFVFSGDTGRDDNTCDKGNTTATNRGDVMKLDHSYIEVGAGGTCVENSGAAQTLQINNVECETHGRGIHIHCPDAKDWGNACPEFISMNDMEVEGFGSGYSLIDASDFKLLKCVNCYLRGVPGAGRVANLVSLRQGRLPYTGVAEFTTSWLRYADAECVFSDAYAVKLTSSHVSDCGMARRPGQGYGIHLAAARSAQAGHGIIADNTFCLNEYGAFSGSAAPGSGSTSAAMRAVRIGRGSDWNLVHDNVMDGCAGGGNRGGAIVDDNPGPSNNRYHDNIGPP